MARTYTDTEKADAVALVLEVGPTDAGKRLDIPKSTLSSWLTPEQSAAMAERTTAKTKAATDAAKARRLQVRGKLLERAERMLDRMTEVEVDYRGQLANEVIFPEASAGSCKAFATAAAILIDKYRLELGEVTDRTEHRTVDQVTAEVERLAEELQAHDPVTA